ncbi:urea carboxylase protein [Rutstroemia sp. NJR-2017a BBW]|nr:urea carboxylase protein [Rutstroemia sp. NJR-2017a BBW]
MTSPSSFHEVESYDRQWDPFEDDFPSQQHAQLQEVEKLGFCQLRDWDEGRTYNESPAKYIHYSIHWSFKIHNRMQSTNTETDLVLELASYWRLYLKPKLDQTCHPGPSQVTNESAIRSIDIPGFRDEAVEKYCAWHQSKVRKPAQKQEYQKACDIMIGECMDLELIYQEPDPEFLITGGVKRGPALHIVRDIGKWVGECKRIRIDE